MTTNKQQQAPRDSTPRLWPSGPRNTGRTDRQRESGRVADSRAGLGGSGSAAIERPGRGRRVSRAVTGLWLATGLTR
ncbi:hypothetical protein ACOMHN_031994 [Nucella lapillus]